MTDVNARKPCPYEAENEVRSRYLAGALPEAEAEAYERHYFDCPACAEAIEVGTRLRAGFGRRPVEVSSPRARVGRPWLALAAAVAAALIAFGVLETARRTPAAPTSVLRSGGDAPQHVRVDAGADGSLNVHWMAVAGATRYAVRVHSSDGSELWKTETAEPRAAVPRADLQSAAGKPLRVEVDALDARGRVLGTSEPARVP